MRKLTKERCDATINIRVSSQDLDLIDRAAKTEGKNRAQFLRECAERAGRAALQDDER